MTVHRIAGPVSPDTGKHRIDLGPVIVTIDDLDALMTLLTRPGEGNPSTVSVDFNGGYFTEAADLSKLSNVETKALRLRTPKVYVVRGALSPLEIIRKLRLFENGQKTGKRYSGRTD